MDRSKLRRTILDPELPFSFSQASLQDYVDCQRRFQLRYLQQVSWPAPQAEPVRENEEHIQRGERFHRLAQQALLRVPLERLEPIAASDPDEALSRWWRSFTALLPQLNAGQRRVEIQLSAPLGRHRLLAKYDLIQLFPEERRAVIWDWKTSTNLPRRDALEARLQTLVYPTLLVRASGALNDGTPFQPEQVEMVYWFAELDRPERFAWDATRQQRAEENLLALTGEIESIPGDRFEKTPDEKRCRFCVYRSLCARGVRAGDLSELDADVESSAEIVINFDQIGEIQF